MDARVTRLTDDLLNLADWFHQNREEHWADRCAESAALLRKSDARGLDVILSCFGTMGSIGDRLGPAHVCSTLSSVYDRASEFRREHHRVMDREPR